MPSTALPSSSLKMPWKHRNGLTGIFPLWAAYRQYSSALCRSSSSLPVRCVSTSTISIRAASFQFLRLHEPHPDPLLHGKGDLRSHPFRGLPEHPHLVTAKEQFQPHGKPRLPLRLNPLIQKLREQKMRRNRQEPSLTGRPAVPGRPPRIPLHVPTERAADKHLFPFRHTVTFLSSFSFCPGSLPRRTHTP